MIQKTTLAWCEHFAHPEGSYEIQSISGFTTGLEETLIGPIVEDQGDIAEIRKNYTDAPATLKDKYMGPESNEFRRLLLKHWNINDWNPVPVNEIKQK